MLFWAHFPAASEVPSLPVQCVAAAKLKKRMQGILGKGTRPTNTFKVPNEQASCREGVPCSGRERVLGFLLSQDGFGTFPKEHGFFVLWVRR